MQNRFSLSSYLWRRGYEKKINTNLITVFPNPLSINSRIIINSTNYKDLKLIISNSSGITKIFRRVNNNDIILHRNEFRSGLYIIQLLENNKTIATKKLIVE